MQSHGWTFLKFPAPPYWNAGARPRIPHRGSTWEHSVPSVRTQTNPQVMAECAFPHINANNSSQWTVRICFCFCRMLLWRVKGGFC